MRDSKKLNNSKYVWTTEGKLFLWKDTSKMIPVDNEIFTNNFNKVI